MITVFGSSFSEGHAVAGKAVGSTALLGMPPTAHPTSSTAAARTQTHRHSTMHFLTRIYIHFLALLKGHCIRPLQWPTSCTTANTLASFAANLSNRPAGSMLGFLFAIITLKLSLGSAGIIPGLGVPAGLISFALLKGWTGISSSMGLAQKTPRLHNLLFKPFLVQENSVMQVYLPFFAAYAMICLQVHLNSSLLAVAVARSRTLCYSSRVLPQQSRRSIHVSAADMAAAKMHSTAAAISCFFKTTSY